MYLPLSSKYTFLRWHYPNQVYGSKFRTSSQPVKQAPLFIYKIQYSSDEKKCQYEKGLAFYLKGNISEISCKIKEHCFYRTVICFCNTEHGKMHKKNRVYSKKSCERAEIAQSPLTNEL